MKTQGFTLIEVIIYLTLFSLLMTGVLQTVYLVLEATETSGEKIAILAESTFIHQKFTWALAGATDVSVVSSTMVRITRQDLGTESPILFTVSGGVWYLARGSAPPLPLSTRELIISDTAIVLVPVGAGTRSILHIRYRVAGTPFVFQSVLPYE